MGLRLLDMPRGLIPAVVFLYALFIWVALSVVPASAQQAPDSYPGCQYVTSPTTLTSGQTSRFLCTNDRKLKVETTPASGSTTDVNITKVGGSAVTTSLPVAGIGTAGTANAGVLTVQGIASMTPVQVGGTAVDDAAASGNPVPVGGIYNTTLPTYTNLDRTQLQSNARGGLYVQITDQNLNAVQAGTNAADGIANNFSTLMTASRGYLLNGSATLDRQRSVVNATDSTGTGIAAAGILSQLDDTATGTVTENQFTNTRLAGERGLYVTQLKSATAASGIATVKSSSLESNHVIKSSPGNLYGWAVTTGATPGWVLLFNGTSAPSASGAAIAPEKCIYAPANATISGTNGPVPQYFSTGIVIVFSSTGCLTNTASATAFISGDAS